MTAAVEGFAVWFCTSQVFLSVDETDSAEQDPGGQQDPTPTAAPAPAAAEFDSPDSGLPSSRNYSVASGILSSIDDGQGGSFEDGAEEEGSAELGRTEAGTARVQRAKPAVLQSQDSVSEEQLSSQVDYLADVASVCAASYTVGHT